MTTTLTRGDAWRCFESDGDDMPTIYLPETYEVRFEAPRWAPDMNVTLGALWRDEDMGYQVEYLTIRSRDGGRPVTSELIRELPIAKMVQLTARIARNRLPAGLPTVDQARIASAAGPVSDSLRYVAFSYRYAVTGGHAPAISVASVLGLPKRTASHWIKLARERGQLTDAAPIACSAPDLPKVIETPEFDVGMEWMHD